MHLKYWYIVGAEKTLKKHTNLALCQANTSIAFICWHRAKFF